MTSWWSLLVEKVLNHADRIQELCLSIRGDLLPTQVSLNAPRLQILDIRLEWVKGEAAALPKLPRQHAARPTDIRWRFSSCVRFSFIPYADRPPSVKPKSTVDTRDGGGRV